MIQGATAIVLPSLGVAPEAVVPAHLPLQHAPPQYAVILNSPRDTQPDSSAAAAPDVSEEDEDAAEAF